MIIVAVLAALMATQGKPLLPPPWVQGDLSTADEYAKYGKLEPDGTYSIVSASRHVCNCKVSVLESDWIKDLKATGVTITHDTQTMCGVSAVHILAVGVAKANDKSTQNDDAFIFRQGPAAFIMQYRSRYPQPHSDEVKALGALCPGASPQG
jgi:hypothetical protein